MILLAAISIAQAGTVRFDTTLGYAAVNPFLAYSRTAPTTPIVSTFFGSCDMTFITTLSIERSSKGVVLTEGGPMIGVGYDGYHSFSLRGGYAFSVFRADRETMTLKILAEGFRGEAIGAMAGFALDSSFNRLLTIDSDVMFSSEIGMSIGIEDDLLPFENGFWLTSRFTLGVNARL